MIEDINVHIRESIYKKQNKPDGDGGVFVLILSVECKL